MKISTLATVAALALAVGSLSTVAQAEVAPSLDAEITLNNAGPVAHFGQTCDL